jgi:hypothetical protein
MHTNDYEVVRYSPEFKQEIIELLAPMWGEDLGLTTSYFEWKHSQNPYVDEPIFYLCLYEGRVIGVRACFGARWQLDQPGKYVNCLADADAIVHPDHRRQGLLTKMTVAALEDLRESEFEYVITLSANRYSSAANVKMGWRNIGYLDTAYRYSSKEPDTRKSQNPIRNSLRRVPAVPAVYRRVRGYFNPEPAPSNQQLHPFYTLDKNYVLKAGQKFEHLSIEDYPRPGEMVDLISRSGEHNRIQHIRDLEFFSWRYQNPLSSYRFLFWKGTRLEGYLVLQSPIHKPGVVTIVDWEASTQQVRERLLRAAIELGSFFQLSIWSISLNDENKKLLQQTGFEFKEPSGDDDKDGDLPHVLIRSVRTGWVQGEQMSGNNYLQDLSNWDLRAIYADGY